jgi:hypothetical protein
METNSPDQGYLQLAFNICQLRKQFHDLDAALNNPAISIALRRVASNLAKPTKQPRHLKGALND